MRRLRRGLDHGRSRDRDRESAEHANEGRTDDKAAYSHERFLDPVPRLVKSMSSAAAPMTNQDPRSATHELQLTPLAENWTP